MSHSILSLGLAESGSGLATFDIVFLCLWVVMGALYWSTYRKTESLIGSFAKVAGLLGFVYLVMSGFNWLEADVPVDQVITFGFGDAVAGPRVPLLSQGFTWFVSIILVMVVWYARGKFSTVSGLILSAWDRGHWYMLPVIFVLMTVGLLLVAAAASPVLSPFIYTLF
ncbi:MAG: hypothetical protein ACI9EF_000524 [Pseudohongiellaceae bacterium]